MNAFQPIQQEQIRNQNRSKVLALFRSERRITQLEIVRMSGISLPTVTTIVRELKQEGIIRVDGFSPADVGRRAAIYKFDSSARNSFGVDISSTTLQIIRTDLDLKVLSERTISHDKQSLSEFGHIIDLAFTTIEKICEEENIDSSTIAGVGFSLPGTVNEESMLLETAPHLDNVRFSFSDLGIEKSYPFFIENRANAAALAELWTDPVSAESNMVYVGMNRGIGTAIAIHGLVYKGRRKRAGEYGHVTVGTQGRVCACGRLDCWETYAGTDALIQKYRELSGREAGSLSEFFRLVDSGDQYAVSALDELVHYISIGLQNIILIHDPDLIVLGGRLVEYGDYFWSDLMDSIYNGSRFFSPGDVRLKIASYLNNSSLMGAALLPLQPIFFSTKKTI